MVAIAWAAVTAFIVSLIGTSLFINYCKQNNLLGIDRHKISRYAAVSGGLPVMFSIIVGVLLYISLETSFALFDIIVFIIPLLLSLLSLTIIMYVGLLDDFSKKSGGLNQFQKPILSVLAAIPLIVVTSTMTLRNLPFIGEIDLGWVYYLVVPIIIIGTSNMVNLLGGFNGLEAGLGIIFSGMFTIYGFARGNKFVSILSLIVFSALLGFYYYNRFPSKIFPGDSLTYMLGGYIGILVIYGKVEVQAFLASIPYIIEGILKARSKFQAQSFCEVNGGQKLMHTGPIYSIPHILGKFMRFTEEQLVWIIMGFQLLCSSLIWLI